MTVYSLSSSSQKSPTSGPFRVSYSWGVIHSRPFSLMAYDLVSKKVMLNWFDWLPDHKHTHKPIALLKGWDPWMIPKWSSKDPHMIPKWSPIDPQLVPKWSPNDPQMIPRWSSHDAHMIPKWSPHDSQTIPTWSPNAFQMIPKSPSSIIYLACRILWYIKRLFQIDIDANPLAISIVVSNRHSYYNIIS